MSTTSKSRKSIWDPTIVRRAAIDSVLKLNPRKMMGNPVMFVVEVGSVITTILLILRPHEAFKFNLQITLWLWFTVMFANFAEAMAEGRGKAQADTLRKARSETVANRLCANGKWSRLQAPACGRMTLCWYQPESLFPETVRSSTALRRWMSRPLPGNQLR